MVSHNTNHFSRVWKHQCKSRKD